MVASLLLVVAGCAVLRISDAELLAHQRGPATLAPPLRIVWTYNAGAGFGQAGAVVLGNHVLVATRSGDLHAVSVESGGRLGVKSFGDALEAAPLIQGSMLYVPVDMGRRALYGYSLEHSTVEWRRKGPPVSVGLLDTERGFVSVDTHAAVRHHAGEQVLWEQHLGEDRFVHARPVQAAGYVIVADNQGTVHALEIDTGAARWATALGVPVYTSMAAHADRVYVATTRGKLFALAASTGAVLWRYAHPDAAVRLATPAADAAMVVFGGTDGTVTALDSETGMQLWQWEGPDAVVAAPYMNAHAIYVGSMGAVMYALDRSNGAVLWQEELRGRVKSDIVGYDDFLVVLSEPRHVYLLKADEEAQ